MACSAWALRQNWCCSQETEESNCFPHWGANSSRTWVPTLLLWKICANAAYKKTARNMSRFVCRWLTRSDPQYIIQEMPDFMTNVTDHNQSRNQMGLRIHLKLPLFNVVTGGAMSWKKWMQAWIWGSSDLSQWWNVRIGAIVFCKIYRDTQGYPPWADHYHP